jgi:hypothetical protein
MRLERLLQAQSGALCGHPPTHLRGACDDIPCAIIAAYSALSIARASASPMPAPALCCCPLFALPDLGSQSITVQLFERCIRMLLG